MDATYTKTQYNQKSPREFLVEKSKLLRKTVFRIDENMKEKFLPKITINELADVIEYCQKVIEVVEKEEVIHNYPSVKEKLNYLKEVVEYYEEHLSFSDDPDARVGHKTADSSFFSYKIHLAMNDERIITVAVITIGEKSDRKYFQTLIEKGKETGIEIDTIIGDTVYSEKENIQYTQTNHLQLVSKLNPIISQGNHEKKDEFEFNKYVGIFIYKAGHMATRKVRTGKKNQVLTYYFDIKNVRYVLLKRVVIRKVRRVRPILSRLNRKNIRNNKNSKIAN